MTQAFIGWEPQPQWDSPRHLGINYDPFGPENRLAECDIQKLTELADKLRTLETIEATAVADIISGWIIRTQLPLHGVQTGRFRSGTAQADWADHQGHKGCGENCSCDDKCGGK